MSEPTAAAPPEPPPPAALPVRRRLVRGLFAPLRFARRRPARALGVLALLLLLATAAVALGAWVWFEYHLRAARAHLDKGHNAAAVAHLRKCRLIRPEAPEVLILSARAARRAGSWDEADTLLARYSELYGDEDAVVSERLFLRAARGEVEAVAPPLLARVRQGGPEAALAREALVTGLIYRFRWGAAQAQIDDWLAADPDSTAALLLRGKLEEQRRLFPPAVATYRRVLELDPEQDEARLRLTGLLLDNRQGEEALAHLEELRKRLADHPEVQVQWAKALALQGRTAECRAALDACLRDYPDHAAALAERGMLRLIDGDEAGAERDLLRAVALDPGNTAVRSQYALALSRNGKRADAARQEANIAILKADQDRVHVLTSGPLQANPNDPAVHHEIALIALRSGQIAEALRWFNSALQVDPGHVPTHRALAGLYRQLDNPILAARHRALAQQPADPPKP